MKLLKDNRPPDVLEHVFIPRTLLWLLHLHHIPHSLFVGINRMIVSFVG